VANKIAENGLNYDKICLKSVSINHISFLRKTGVNKSLHLYQTKGFFKHRNVAVKEAKRE